MEPVGAFSDEELQCLSRMFCNVDADFMLQLHDHDMFSNDHRGNGNGMAAFETPCFFSTNAAIDDHNVAMAADENLFSSSDHTFNTNSCPYFSQESSNSSGSDHQANDVNFLHVTPDQSMEFYDMDNKSDHTVASFFTDEAMDNILNMKEDIAINGKLGNADDHQPMAIDASGNQEQLKRKFPSSEDSLSNDSSDNPKKKSRVSRDTQKIRKNAQPRKNKKIIQDCKIENENETNGGQNMQSSSPSMSEDDSNASQELSGGATSDSKGSAALNSNGKARASRGSATDSQSLYARRRRERINERLRILQNLVPNGTKVDISTMLEEAVQYVKFLQLQIKLLSSDDLWMYAPIAYNGMDIGAYQKMLPYL